MMTNTELFDACKAAGAQEAQIRDAAHDMLDALQKIVSVFPYFPASSEERAALAKALAAIAKATGQ